MKAKLKKQTNLPPAPPASNRPQDAESKLSPAKKSESAVPATPSRPRKIPTVAALAAAGVVAAAMIIIWLAVLANCSESACMVFGWQRAPRIESFEACAAAGFPILQTQPLTCTAGGRNFFQNDALPAPVPPAGTADPTPDKPIAGFADCEARGYPVLPTEPRQCLAHGAVYLEKAAPPVDSGVSGKVLLGPTCPVVRYPPDPACADKPYATRLDVVDAGGRLVAYAASGPDGTFDLSLNPGSYTLKPEPSGKPFPRGETVQFKVDVGRYTFVTVHFDTGIR